MCTGNPWNRFQHEHQGMYTRNEMSAAYARSGYATAAPAYSSSSFSSGAPTNSWNAYQHANGGRGWSRGEMQANYHASKR